MGKITRKDLKDIHWERTVDKIKAAIKAHNEGKEKREQVRQGHFATAIHLYKRYQVTALGKDMMPTPLSFVCNGAEVSLHLGYHPRTFDGHMERLQAARICWRDRPAAYGHQNRKSIRPVGKTSDGRPIYDPRPQEYTSEVIINPDLLVFKPKEEAEPQPQPQS